MDLQALRTQLEEYGELLVCEQTIDFNAIQIVMQNVSNSDLSDIELVIENEIISTYPVKDLFDLDVYLKVRYKK